MVDYLCTYTLRRVHMSNMMGKRSSSPFTGPPFTLRLSPSHQGLLARKKLERNPETRQERTELGLIRLRDERLNIGFRAE